MDLHSGHIVGTEALIGWDKPETGLIAPDEFLPSCSFPIDKLKNDLISGIPANRDAVALTQAIIAMAQLLDMRVTAEGVEDQQQMLSLKDAGCQEIQGFYFSKPLTAKHFAARCADTVIGKPCR